MPSKPQVTFGELAVHLAMGVGLGTMLALLLITMNAADIFGMIRNTSDPVTTLGLFIGGLASSFGIGATLTGLIFTQMEKQ